MSSRVSNQRLVPSILLLVLTSASGAWAGEGSQGEEAAAPVLAAPAPIASPGGPLACLGATTGAESAGDLALLTPEPTPMCSGDDCGCFEPPCNQQCESGDQDCFRACFQWQKSCARACCTPNLPDSPGCCQGWCGIQCQCCE
jgi:hypothetical protein